MKQQSVGILGVSAYLPPGIRKNDFWPEEVSRKWQEKAAKRLESTREHLTKDGSPIAKASGSTMPRTRSRDGPDGAGAGSVRSIATISVAARSCRADGRRCG